MAARIRKRNLIVSYNNLDDKLKELFKERYPDGYRDHLQKTIKPNGEPIFVAPLETEDTMYMVKFEVKIDSGLVEEDLDKDLYGGEEEEKGEEGEFASLSEAIDKEEGNTRVGTLKHGDYDDLFINETAKQEFEQATADIIKELGEDLDDDEDDYADKDKDDEDDDDFGDEPSDEDLLGIDSELADIMNDGTGLLRDVDDDAPKRKRGRPRKNADAPAPAPKEAKEAKPAAHKAKSAADKAKPATDKAKKTRKK